MLLIYCLILSLALLLIAGGTFILIDSLIGSLAFFVIGSFALLLIGGFNGSAALLLIGCLALLLIGGLIGGLTLVLNDCIALVLEPILLVLRADLLMDSGAFLSMHGLTNSLVGCGALVLIGGLVDSHVLSSALWGVASLDTGAGQRQTNGGNLKLRSK